MLKHWHHSDCSCDSRKRPNAHGSAMFVFPVDEKAHNCSQIGDIHSRLIWQICMCSDQQRTAGGLQIARFSSMDIIVNNPKCCTHPSQQCRPTMHLQQSQAPCSLIFIFALVVMSPTWSGLQTSMPTLIAISAPQAEILWLMCSSALWTQVSLKLQML